ncbi:hypothetical protein F2P81_018813 [Scophthalmus maximus]|uniref:Uncharacterized protein n=1 Tax=Scophthalmus maximus TaxID=52904 RepID=A0A6A4SBN2_SCOMX|nr:hypothetical protein F2P81_018813 [Scophthalmus maximus]
MSDSVFVTGLQLKMKHQVNFHKGPTRWTDSCPSMKPFKLMTPAGTSVDRDRAAEVLTCDLDEGRPSVPQGHSSVPSLHPAKSATEQGTGPLPVSLLKRYHAAALSDVTAEEQRSGGPEEQRTGGAEDRRSRGPEDRRSRGPEDRSNTGNSKRFQSRWSLQSKLRLGSSSSCSLTDLSGGKTPAGGGGGEKGGTSGALVEECSKDKGTQQRRAGANATWNSIHNAVISVFQRKELGENELYTLNEGVRQLLKTELGSFFTEYLQNQLLTKGMVILRDKIRFYEGTHEHTHRHNQLPIHALRDGKRDLKMSKLSPNTHYRTGNNDQASTQFTFFAARRIIKSTSIEKRLQRSWSSKAGGSPVAKNLVVRSKSYNVPMLTPVVEYDADSPVGGGTGIRRHSVSEMTSCAEESSSVAESGATGGVSTSSLANPSAASAGRAPVSGRTDRLQLSRLWQ